MPVQESDHDHRDHRHEDKNLKRRRDLAHHLNAAHVDPGNDGDQSYRHEIVLPSRDSGKVVRQVIGEQNSVGSAQQKRCRPIPPSRKKSPEVSEGRARPAVKAAFNRHGSSKFRRHQRDGNAPEKRQHQQVDQRHPRARGGHHVLEPEGPARGVGKHHEDEIEESGLAEGGGWVVSAQGFVVNTRGCPISRVFCEKWGF